MVMSKQHHMGTAEKMTPKEKFPKLRNIQVDQRYSKYTLENTRAVNGKSPMIASAVSVKSPKKSSKNLRDSSLARMLR